MQFNQSHLILLLIPWVSSSDLPTYNQCLPNQTITQDTFILESPIETSNRTCLYTIPTNKSCPTLTVKIHSFNIPYSKGCKNRLEIGDQDALCGVNYGEREYTNPTTFKYKSNLPGNYKLEISKKCRTKRYLQVYPRNLPQCCRNLYNQPRFYLTTPLFPNSTPNDCVFVINRSGPNVCGVRLFLKYALVGTEDCRSGFVEVGGQRYCGCKTGMVVSVSYNYGDSIIVRYRNDGHSNQGSANGLLVEVTQLGCRRGRELESNALLGNVGDLLCKKFTFLEWVGIQALELFQRTGNCLSNENGNYPSYPNYPHYPNYPNYPNDPNYPNNPSTCIVLNGPSGTMQSPGYPLYYDGGLNLCFR